MARFLPHLACTLLLCSVVQVARGSGQFQVQILSIENLRSDNPDGICCRPPNSNSGQQKPQEATKNATEELFQREKLCSSICRPYLRLCFKQFQRNVVLAQNCIMEGFSPVLALPITQGNNSRVNAINLPFSFGWMKSYTMIMELLDAKGAKAERSVDNLLEQGVQSEDILPGPAWRRHVHAGKTAVITYQVRVVCDPFYGNTTCVAYCKPRNDYFGHYYCNSDSQRVCLDGWTGPNCEKAICSATCQNGNCLHPGECSCRPGWKGENCDKCTKHSACKHGQCRTKAWECVCDPGWGGPMCDRDLNFCGRNSPCSNYAVCHNTAEPNFYECRCPEGFSGTDCDQIVDPCESNALCQNGGQCFNNNGTAQCRCAAGWAGAACSTDINECLPNPCENGATCIDEIAAYQCICSPGFTGSTCQNDIRPALVPEITSITFFRGNQQPDNASAVVAKQTPAPSTKPPTDESNTILTVVLSVFLMLALLCLVLLCLFFYRRRQKLRRNQEASVNNDKYGCSASNNRQQTKDLLHKDNDIHVIRCNQENEARLKILNNIFTPETRSPVSEDNLSHKSDSSSSSLTKKSLYSDTDPPKVRFVSETANAHITGRGTDPYWNNRDRPNLYATKDTKNRYMESMRKDMLDGRSPAVPTSPHESGDDFTVV